MSKRHPVVAVTGSSGAGTSTVKRAFEHIFAREGIRPAVVEGDSYHRYERGPMKEAMAAALAKGENFSHFGPEANLFDKLEELFRTYGETGSGQKRYYLHSVEEAAEHNGRLGTSLELHCARLVAAGVDTVNLHHTEWSGGQAVLCHRFGLNAFGWDLQHEEPMTNALRMGLDGVYSDRVDMMVEAYGREVGPPALPLTAP